MWFLLSRFLRKMINISPAVIARAATEWRKWKKGVALHFNCWLTNHLITLNLALSLTELITKRLSIAHLILMHWRIATRMPWHQICISHDNLYNPSPAMKPSENNQWILKLPIHTHKFQTTEHARTFTKAAKWWASYINDVCLFFYK